MARFINYMLVFLYSIMLFGTLLQSTGVAGMLGLGLQLGAADAQQDIQETAGEGVATGSTTGDTLFGLYNVLGGRLGDLLAVVNPGLQTLSNAGVPSYLMEGFLMPIATVTKVLGVIYFFRGL